MELSALRSFNMARSAGAVGDARASGHARRRHSNSSASSSSDGRSVSSASSVAGSSSGLRDGDDESDELQSFRSNASSRSGAGGSSSSIALARADASMAPPLSGSSASSAAALRDAQLNLPLDKEFVPLAHHEDDEDEDDAAAREAMAARDDTRDDVIRMIFDLPLSTRFYQDFSCSIAGTLVMHGRMYPTSAQVCFYSNVFGRERKILIPYESISEVTKTTTMVFQHAIRLATTAKDEYTFTSFWGTNRDACYDLIVKTRSRVLSELQPAVARGLKLAELSSRAAAAPPTSPPATKAPPPRAGDDTDDADSDAASPTVRAVANTSVTTTAVAQVATQPTAAVESIDSDVQSTLAATVETQAEATSEELAPPTLVRRSSVVSDVGSVAPRDISMTQIADEALDVSTDAFMRAFFWDGAPFGLDAFGATQRYSEIKVTPWTALEDDSAFGKTRSLQFRVPIDAPIGPKSSQVDVLQVAKSDERGVFVIEGSTRLVDIPYGDYFSVEDRWTIVPNGTGKSRLSIELKVVFSKSTIWKSKIETRAIADNKAKWAEWVERAKQHLADAQAAPQEAPIASGVDSEAAALATSATTAVTTAATPEAVGTESEQPLATELSRRDAPQLATQSSSASAKSAKRRASRASSSSSHRGAARSSSRAPSASFILYLRVFPWILVLGLLFLVVRMQASLGAIEQTLVRTTDQLSAIELQLEALALGACGVPMPMPRT